MPKLLPGCLAAILMIASSAALAAPRSDSADANVRESQQYEQLLCTNAAFRNKRIAQECGPLTDRVMHENCVASFQCGGPPTRRSNMAPPTETIR